MARGIVIGVVLLVLAAIYIADPLAIQGFVIGFILRVLTPIGAAVALLALIVGKFTGIFKGW